MLFDIWNYMSKVKYIPIFITIRVFIWLKAKRTMIKGQSPIIGEVFRVAMAILFSSIKMLPFRSSQVAVIIRRVNKQERNFMLFILFQVFSFLNSNKHKYKGEGNYSFSCNTKMFIWYHVKQADFVVLWFHQGNSFLLEL